MLEGETWGFTLTEGPLGLQGTLPTFPTLLSSEWCVVLELAVAAHYGFSGLAGLRSRMPAPCFLSSARNCLLKSHFASTVSRAPQGRQAAIVLASAQAGLPDQQPASRMKCFVIGAGFSGLAAARTLADEGSGVEVIVLEAGSRVGGRAHTAQVRSAMPFV